MALWISFDKKTFIFISLSFACKSFRCTVQLVWARFRWGEGWNTCVFLMWGITEMRGQNTEASKNNGELTCTWLDTVASLRQGLMAPWTWLGVPGHSQSVGVCGHWAGTVQDSFGCNCKNSDAKSAIFLI